MTWLTNFSPPKNYLLLGLLYPIFVTSIPHSLETCCSWISFFHSLIYPLFFLFLSLYAKTGFFVHFTSSRITGREFLNRTALGWDHSRSIIIGIIIITTKNFTTIFFTTEVMMRCKDIWLCRKKYLGRSCENIFPRPAYCRSQQTSPPILQKKCFLMMMSEVCRKIMCFAIPLIAEIF